MNLRKLGLIGGMSWVSTRSYYERINRIVQARVSSKASAPMLIENLDFTQLYRISDEAGWDHAASVLIESGQRLIGGGAGAIVVAANSMHKVYDRLAEELSVPVINIADCVGQRMASDGVKVAALLGTANVMTEGFYRRRLIAHGIDLLAPDMSNVERLDSIIYEQLMQGKVTRDAERQLKSIITVKAQEGAEAIVLACTELELVVDVAANVLPIYDSARLHAHAAAEWILGEE